jgi:hypothetical protein
MKYHLHAESSTNPFARNYLKYYKLPQFLLNKPEATKDRKDSSPMESMEKIKKTMAEKQAKKKEQ